MRKVVSISLVFIFFVALAGCQSNQTRIGEGAVIGGLLGATAGGIIGHQGGHGAEGAGIGAAAGVLGGAIVGSQINKQPAQQNAGSVNSTQLSVTQIVDMSKQGINEAVIIDKIHLTNSRFNLTPVDIDYLKQQGVSQNVINAMQGH